MDTAESTDRRSLSDICSRAFSLILTLGSGHNLGDFAGLRSRISSTLAQVEAEATQAGYTTEDARLARYALTALVDEVIQRTDWEGKTEWLSNPLSLQEFNDNRAGDEFFTKLSELRRQVDSKAEVLEVFYLCLAIGFEGKYALSDPRERRTLLEDIGRDLERVKPGSTDLSPHWQPEKIAGVDASQLPLGVIFAIGAGIVCIVFIVLNVLLESQVHNLTN